jgi:hypothetical protein
MDNTTLQPSRKALKLWASLVGFGAVVAVIVSTGFGFSRPVTRARDLLAQSATLQIGQSGLSEVEAVTARFGVRSANDCTSDECQLVVMIDNSRLPKWWRGSGTTLGVSFLVQKGILVEREYALAVGVGPNRPFAEVREREHWRERTEPVDIQTSWDVADRKWRATVDLTTAATPELRNRYLSFNLRCLSKFGGCTDAQQLLPTVEWKK